MSATRIAHACLLAMLLEFQGSQPLPTSAHKAPEVTQQPDGSVVFVTKELRVDADGAPNSYLVNGKGLSRTCDGVAAIVNGRALTTKDKDWQSQCQTAWANAVATKNYTNVRIFGFSHDKANVPILQRTGDPLPNVAFRTETTLAVAGAPKNSQNEFVDATRIPYVVLPGWFEKKFKVSPGDLVMVYRPQNGAVTFAVFGDEGGLGEASVKLHFNLGGAPVVCSGRVDRASDNIEDKVWTVVFPGVSVETGLDATAWNARIQDAGVKALSHWGGTARLKTIAGGDPVVRAMTPPGSDRLTPCKRSISAKKS